MPEHCFTLGICATDDMNNITRLMERVSNEVLPLDCRICDIVIVVSGSTDGTDMFVSSYFSSLQKTVILEEERKGKSEAVNRIICCMKGRSLILVNGDALPDSGSIALMMESMKSTDCSVVCAVPIPADSRATALVRHISAFLWGLHNNTMAALQARGEKIHLSDEMIGLNPQALIPLPEGTVNDGAYIAARAQQYGQKVSFCRGASVRVSIPTGLHGFFSQRRRILFGHMLVREMSRSPPATVEFKFLERPLLCLGILLRSLKEHPEGIMVLPCILAVEFLALAAALMDRKNGASTHVVWTRVENASWRRV